MYVTYDYYKNTFGGSTISDTSFAQYERKARVFLDYITFDRLKIDSTLVTESVMDCLCEIMECNFNIYNSKEDKLISSETVGSYNVTYAISDIEKNEVDRSKINDVKYYNIAKRYLSNTNLLYKGVDRN